MSSKVFLTKPYQNRENYLNVSVMHFKNFLPTNYISKQIKSKYLSTNYISK